MLRMAAPLTREQCEEFLRNPVRNPFTGAVLRNPNAERGTAIRRICEFILRNEPVPPNLLETAVIRTMTTRATTARRQTRSQTHATNAPPTPVEQTPDRPRQTQSPPAAEAPVHRRQTQSPPVAEAPTRPRRTRAPRATQAEAAPRAQRRTRATQPVPNVPFIFNQQEIPHQEVANALFQYGLHSINNTLNQFHNYFIMRNTTDFETFHAQAMAYYPYDWAYRYVRAGIQRERMPRFTNPYPHQRIPPIPTLSWNGHEVTYRQAIVTVYNMLRAINARQHFDPPPFIRDEADGRAFGVLASRTFPNDWLTPWVNAGMRGEPMPVYTDPPEIIQPAENRTPSNKPASFSSKTPAEETIAQTCKTMFHGIERGNPFKGIVNTMLKHCNVFIDKCDNNRIKAIRQRLSSKRYAPARRIDEIIPDPDLAFQHIFNSTYAKNQTKVAMSMAIFKSLQENVSIRNRGQAGIGVGVFRDFIKNCLNCVKNNPGADDEHSYERVKFFMPIYPGATRCVLNPHFNVQQAKQLGYKSVKTEDDILRLYNMIGQLFAFATRMDAPVPVYLSRTILAYILHKQDEIKPELSLMYYLMDSDPDVTKSTLELMRVPEYIEYAYINMNDHYPLVAEDKPVEADNFVKYIDLFSRYKYLRQFQKDAPDTFNRLKAFVKGFYIANDLKENKVTVRELEKMMCGAPVSLEAVREWLNTNHIRYVVNDRFNERNQQRVIEWFKEILNEMGATIPLDEINEAILKEKINSEDSTSRSSDSANKIIFRSKRRAFLHFFIRLMEFWTSYPKIDMESAYQVRFEREVGFPTSHTCFRQLCLTCNDIHSKQDLYVRLVKAVFSVERGIGEF